MKKKYEKPMILVENFSLSTTVAGGCEVKTDTQNSGNCGLDFGDGTIFLTDVAGCMVQVEVDDAGNNGMCYHVPIETNNLFNS